MHNGHTGNYRSLATPLIRSNPESLIVTLSDLYRDLQMRMVVRLAEVVERR